MTSGITGQPSSTVRYVVVIAAFLGWMFAGAQMSVTPLIARSATIDLLWPTQGATKLDQAQEVIVGEWFSWYMAMFLFGAAAGGVVFGSLGDRSGRAKAMGWSIVCYSVFSAAMYFATTPTQLLWLRFAACLGVGGMWPNGIALASEFWSDVSRPLLAGFLGTSANVGLLGMAVATIFIKVTPDSWRWTVVAMATPLPLGLAVLAWLPESPRWLAQRGTQAAASSLSGPVAELIRPPLLWLTLIGMVLGTVPMLGGWGSANWMVPWADKVGALTDPYMKSWTQISRSMGGIVGTFVGGWFTSWAGRRRSYFLISLGSLAISQFIYWELDPRHWLFNPASVALGLVAGMYYGWLPLCLPELFPTRVRATGAGVTFNAGRFASAFGVLGASELMRLFAGDYARVGVVTSMVYAVGLIVIWLVPRGEHARLED